MATIPSKYSKSGMQGNRGQGFVLSVLILRVQRKQRTKNFSFDVAMRRFKKKSGRCRAAGCESIMEKSLFCRLFSAPNSKRPRPRRSLFSLKAHCARVEKKTLSAVFAKAAFGVFREKKPVLCSPAALVLTKKWTVTGSGRIPHRSYPCARCRRRRRRWPCRGRAAPAFLRP